MQTPTNTKHAYLIIAHNHFAQLQTLIQLLDDPRNDIYLHVDKKAKDFRPEDIRTNRSGLFFVDRIRVSWGGQSLIECEMNLMKAAAPKHYQYYHLLSGADLPLKTQEEIHAFFDNGFPQNYISFDAEANQTGAFLPRITYYHFFREWIGRGMSVWTLPLRMLEKGSLFIQRKLGVHRKQWIPAYKGLNWVSITDELVQYTLSQESLIKKQFYRAWAADECYLHSVAMASPCREKIVNNSLRASDWKRGSPYTYRQEDVESLLTSEKLFARKFDCDIDSAAIDEIFAYISQKK